MSKGIWQPAGFDWSSNEREIEVDKWDQRFLDLAGYISAWSKDPSTKVGAVIADQRRIVSLGFNGFPQGMSDDPALYENREEKYSRVVHGEINALLFAHTSVRNHTLYTWPFAPCDRCAVQMIQAGISKFVFPALDLEKQERWKASLDRSKKFFREAGCSYLEVQP